MQASEFDLQFVNVMIFHHDGAIGMSKQAEGTAADPRLRLFADQIVHAQSRQILYTGRLVGE
ncbi:MAG: DUF305 domain-containing protein [Bryobacteraceae bacterium]|nr:DUF305 domain-containing protein [Bryobacteraceae bacterium]